MKDFEFDIKPVERYRSPEIPTFGDNSPALLKKLPKRWQHNAKVIACMGMIGMGTIALSSCDSSDSYSNMRYESLYSEQHDYSYNLQEDLYLRFHTGGAGAGPFYVVYLTEQEALGIIRAQLEAVGLNFNDTPPRRHGVNINRYHAWRGRRLGLDLFDKENNVAIAQLLVWDINLLPREDKSISANAIAREFNGQRHGISVGVFYNPGTIINNPGNRLSEEELTERKAQARPILEERLAEQVDRLIFFLQVAGILDASDEIREMF